MTLASRQRVSQNPIGQVMNRFTTLVLGISIGSVVVLVGFVITILAIESWRVASYDDGYDSVKIGGHVEDIEALLGHPHDVEFAFDRQPVLVDPEHPLGWGFCPPGENLEQLIEQGKLSVDHIDRFYVYRIERFTKYFPVRFRIGLSASGKVVRKHRDANGC
jgi:hypothetical protein